MHADAAADRLSRSLPVGRTDPDGLARDLVDRAGSGFRHLRIHADSRADLVASSHDARAVTLGSDIYFANGEYRPESAAGRHLIAHELAHVMQQSSSPRAGASPPTIQRQARSGGTQTEAAKKSSATNYSSIRMTFDGEYLHVFGDGEEIYTFPAYSGNPTRLSKEDAAACGANQITDSYMNDPRFVGVQDKGPIPEATYSFSPAGIERWGLGAQIALLTHLGGPPQVRSHPGDWGPGRVALNKVTATREGPCPSRGKTKDRFGFFLHGGWLRGSAGCIDIQGQFTTLADFLSGFKKPVLVTVAYKEKTGPFVPYWTGLSGGLNYMTFGFQHGPRLDVGAEFGGVSGTPRALASIAYEGTLAWAGGALSAGLHLDVSMNDKETFVRTGLLGATNARLLKGLYARVFLGPSWLVSGQGSRDARLELGGGLQYDFGRIHLEALYDVLMPMKDDPEVHRVMLGVGMRF